MTLRLETPRLLIEALSREHLETFVEYRRDPLIARFQSWDESYSLQQGIELVESQDAGKIAVSGTWLQLAIMMKSSGELVGDLALHAMDEVGEFEMGFTIARKHQRRGFAYEAASALIAFLFDAQGATRVVASTDHRNQPSRDLLLKLGFTEQPSLGWLEDFKGEEVSVDVFDLRADITPGS